MWECEGHVNVRGGDTGCESVRGTWTLEEETRGCENVRGTWMWEGRHVDLRVWVARECYRGDTCMWECGAAPKCESGRHVDVRVWGARECERGRQMDVRVWGAPECESGAYWNVIVWGIREWSVSWWQNAENKAVKWRRWNWWILLANRRFGTQPSWQLRGKLIDKCKPVTLSEMAGFVTVNLSC